MFLNKDSLSTNISTSQLYSICCGFILEYRCLYSRYRALLMRFLPRLLLRLFLNQFLRVTVPHYTYIRIDSQIFECVYILYYYYWRFRCLFSIKFGFQIEIDKFWYCFTKLNRIYVTLKIYLDTRAHITVHKKQTHYLIYYKEIPFFRFFFCPILYLRLCEAYIITYNPIQKDFFLMYIFPLLYRFCVPFCEYICRIPINSSCLKYIVKQ